MVTAKQIQAWRKKEAQIKQWKEKAAKWDELDKEIRKYYKLQDGTIEVEGDLTDIGEVAARSFGYL